MQKQFIDTSIGKIAVFQNNIKNDLEPVMFLHGVYFDHHLWQHQIQNISDRPVYALDMPLHGESTENISLQWNLQDCADMLVEIIEKLDLKLVYAVGHSWGSMTVLRAAAKKPELFKAIGLCNMPIKPATKMQRLMFWFQHLLTPFLDFYATQAAKAIFDKASLQKHPEFTKQLKRNMQKMGSKAIRQTDKFVILSADDATPMLLHLKVAAMALKGASDYLSSPPNLSETIVPGGHISPLEAPEEVYHFLTKLLTKE